MGVAALSQPSPWPDFLQMKDVPLAGKRVLMRVDFNVPIEHGSIVSDHRILASIPTILTALDAGAAVILVSHLGRPEEGRLSPEVSLLPVARRLERLLDTPVRLMSLDQWCPVAPGEVALIENIRVYRGEKGNDPVLVRQLASLCDVMVMDAFGCAHRRHASTFGVIEEAAIACAGPLLNAEVDSIRRAIDAFRPPLVAVVGGSKVSTKLGVLKKLCERVDCLVTGGGIANTFMVAAGHDVAASLYEADGVDDALQLMETLRARKVQLLLPQDVVCGRSPDSHDPVVRQVGQLADGEMILDIGPSSCTQIEAHIREAGTILWNGPIGVFENEVFANGTRRLAKAIAASDAYSLAGGGETLAAVHRFGADEGISHVSTGGGALLEFIEKGDLPAISALRHRAAG